MNLNLEKVYNETISRSTQTYKRKWC
jgi:hypothetical protein